MLDTQRSHFSSDGHERLSPSRYRADFLATLRGASPCEVCRLPATNCRSKCSAALDSSTAPLCGCRHDGAPDLWKPGRGGPRVRSQASPHAILLRSDCLQRGSQGAKPGAELRARHVHPSLRHRRVRPAIARQAPWVDRAVPACDWTQPSSSARFILPLENQGFRYAPVARIDRPRKFQRHGSTHGQEEMLPPPLLGRAAEVGHLPAAREFGAASGDHALGGP
jgi:hypothetical protein